MRRESTSHFLLDMLQFPSGLGTATHTYQNVPTRLKGLLPECVTGTLLGGKNDDSHIPGDNTLLLTEHVNKRGRIGRV